MLGKILKNQRGEIAIAILVSIMALMSGLSLSMVAGRDANAAIYQMDQVQEFSLLRSELRRGFTLTSSISTSTTSITLPIRYVQISSGESRTTYAMKTRVGTESVPQGMQHTTRRGIQAKIKAFRRPIGYVDYNGTTSKSPIETYGIKYIQKRTFAGYMYLSNIDESENDDPVYFYGYDEIWGRVHSNTDIWLKGVGGWPVFHDHVSTAGYIRYYSTPPDPEEIFLDGYTEETGQIEFNPTAILIRQNGGVMWNEYDIAFVVLERKDYNAWLGDVDEYPPDSMIVYNMYPPYGPVGDSIGCNMVALKDTTWLSGSSGTIEGSSRMVEAGELWISGTCQGEQTWGSEGDMRLVDDLLYFYTEKGDPPDGSAEDVPENISDYLGLVSEKHIYIQYGIFDPRDTLRHHYNCDSYDEGIWIYGALAALGDGEGNSHEDGMFTFEYQYPHYSTINNWFQNEFFDYVDLHLCYYPPNNPPFWPYPQAAYPYAQSPDYPWYNPIWPEEVPYRERGQIHLYGSVAQVRRGFVHRSGNDPLDCGNWNLEDYWYHPLDTSGQNVPGTPTTKSGSGYDKDYHYDNRFIDHPPPDFPEVNIVGKAGLFEGISMRIQRPPAYF